MSEAEKGYFLYDLYETKINSFLLYLEKAKKTYEIEDIHQLRVNTKRINAIYQLIESATDLKFSATYHLKPAEKIFRYAGELREGQMNLEQLKAYGLPSDPMMIYNVYLEKSQVKTIRDLKKEIRNFDRIAFNHTISMIKNYCEQIGKKELIKKMDDYIQMKARSIRELLKKKQNPKNVHKIRMNLKAIDPILSLLNKTDPARFDSKSIDSLKETALYIGDWHDRVILVRSIRKLLHGRKENTMSQEDLFKKLIIHIQTDIQDLLDKIDTNLKETLNYIVH